MDKKQDEAKQTKASQDIINPIFKKNLQALFQQDEILAARLFSMQEQEKYEVFISSKDIIDINIIDKKTLKYIYDNPAKDIYDMLDTLEKEYKRYPIMYFYGLGNGVLYKALLYNQTHKKIVVVEPELEIIYIVLNMIDLSEELASERLLLFYSKFSTYTQFYYMISNEEFSVYAKIYDLHIHTTFYDQFAQDYQKVNKDFTRAISQVVVSQGNSIDDNLQGIEQNIKNLPDMITGYSYTKLIKKRYKLMDTAVIVSTGPSLDKQLATLKRFVPYATIISLDASYPILAKHGIVPDYVTSIERVEATSSFFKKRYGKFDKDIYFIVASLTHRQTIENIKPRRLVLTMRPQQSELIFKLDDYGYLGIGHSTANQAYQLAYVLGHKNIVLIGQDLAFAPDGSSHAKGHAFAQADEYLYVPAYGGEGEVRTTYVWDKFKNQFENDIEESSKEGVITYNCTEGGARIAGATEKPFLETMKELCKDKKIKNLPNINIVNGKMANKNLLKAYDFIYKKLQAQETVKSKIEQGFLSVVKDIDAMLKLRDEGKVNEKMFGKLVKISNKIDKVKNFVSSKRFQKYIENILTISVYFQELELAKISVAPSDTTMQKVNKLLEWIEMHKYWLFSAAGGINAEIETTKKASKNLVKELKKRGIMPGYSLPKLKDKFQFR
ncbi:MULTISPECIES: motility associated factor glycosyltransferase family protein [Campylobacter]|uniref:motility associated factor glycosyltransferase family protein n=1 Tax=Campylobacter TaxID=194 RepID=UPI00146FDFC8|nr:MULTISPECIES: 6-hydroxymethylpterin diphosphokinase MptE-like protein [Campylobacter]MBN7288915.1 motility associated factor glycosyltransferase family protein [Campylobacter curvus]MDU6827200.1 6-hydroxymethylpterin diphosphokinase MptE-like protein [Campylobacter sp.]